MDNNVTCSPQLSILNCQLSILKSYFPTLTDAQKQQIDALFDLYSDWNSKINVISRKDIENLYLHHVLHSLGILKMLKFKEGSTVRISVREEVFPAYHLLSCFLKYGFI